MRSIQTLLAMALVLVFTFAVSALANDPGVDHPPPSRPGDGSPPVEHAEKADRNQPAPSGNAADNARRAHESLKTERRGRGSRPTADQVADAADEFGLSEADFRKRAQVVVTLKDALPFDVYEERRASSDPLLADSRATLLVELDDGYPFMLSGPVASDLGAGLRSFMMSAAAHQRDHEHDDAAADRIAEALRRFDERAVVVGVSLPIAEFDRREQAIRSRYRVAAAEVEADTNATPFKDHGGAMTEAYVRSMREMHRGAAS